MKTLRAPTLNQILARLGYRTSPAPGVYKKHVLKGRRVVFTGDANAVWIWLRETNQII